jgi:nicotinamide mononucleotide (NMN) deamidase PncC
MTKQNKQHQLPSCTGGKIAALTSVSSKYFKGGIVSYATES